MSNHEASMVPEQSTGVWEWVLSSTQPAITGNENTTPLYPPKIWWLTRWWMMGLSVLKPTAEKSLMRFWVSKEMLDWINEQPTKALSGAVWQVRYLPNNAADTVTGHMIAMLVESHTYPQVQKIPLPSFRCLKSKANHTPGIYRSEFCWSTDSGPCQDMKGRQRWSVLS